MSIYAHPRLGVCCAAPAPSSGGVQGPKAAAPPPQKQLEAPAAPAAPPSRHPSCSSQLCLAGPNTLKTLIYTQKAHFGGHPRETGGLGLTLGRQRPRPGPQLQAGLGKRRQTAACSGRVETGNLAFVNKNGHKNPQEQPRT